MARQPEFPANVMTRDQLKELKRSLSMPSPHTVRDNYQKLPERCRLREGIPPAPPNNAGTRDVVEDFVAMAKIVFVDRRPKLPKAFD